MDQDNSRCDKINIKNGNVFAETIENNYLSFLRNINKSKNQ